MSDSTMPVEMPGEEHRRQMRGRFDAVNEAAENKREMKRDSGATKEAKENKRWSWREVEADDIDDWAENDSLVRSLRR